MLPTWYTLIHKMINDPKEGGGRSSSKINIIDACGKVRDSSNTVGSINWTVSEMRSNN